MSERNFGDKIDEPTAISRTVIYAAINFGVAILLAFGVEVSDELRAVIQASAEAIVALVLAINGVIVYYLRMKTKTPMRGAVTKRA